MIQMGGALGRRLAASVDRGADRFDPVRFHFISSLARRCIGKRPSVARRIEQKALMALDAYDRRYEKERREVGRLVDRISSEYPEAVGRVRELFENSDFKGARRLYLRLYRGRNQQALAGLTNDIMQGGALADVNETRLSLDERLRRQEEKILQSFCQAPVSGALGSDGLKAVPRSFHRYKEVWAKQYANGLVNHSIENRPEDPGPLNGQMLAIRCLSTMRNLSPGYLNRFVSFVDTLLWLQQTDRDSRSRTTRR